MPCRLRILAVVLLALAAEGLTVGQQAPSAGFACVADMPIPAYRGVLWIARVTGDAKATIAIGAGGAPSSVEIQSTQRALVEWLKSTLLASIFLKKCAGQTIEIKFVYRLVGGEGDEPRNEVRLKGPNTFEITARPPIPRTEP
jgi:hypothetical protein